MTRRAPATAAAVLALAITASADIIHVDSTGVGGFPTIQEGVNAAAEGDTVLVAPGVYTGPGNFDIDFYGTNLTLASSAGPASTIIDCQGGGAAAIHLFAGEDTTSVISGFTIADARIGVKASSSSPLIVGCTFEHPIVAGVHCQNSAAIVRNCEFLGVLDWTAYPDGVYCEDCLGPTISHCVFDKCERGLTAWECSPVLRNCDFVSCMQANGGGALCYHSFPLFEDCLFYECMKIPPWGGPGVAMYLIQCDSVLRRVRFERCGENNAVDFEVLSAWDGGTIILDRVAFCNNRTRGNTVTLSVNSFEISECTFVGDEWSTGVYVGWGSGTIENSIIAYNEAAVYDADANVTVSHSCVFGNTEGDSLECSHFENIFTWPLFCDRPLGDVTLHDDSPCLPDGNPWGVAMGAYGAGACGTGIDESVPPGETRIQAIAPNPAGREGTRVLVAALPGHEVEIRILDLRGRVVRSLSALSSDEGCAVCFWDHRDTRGIRASAGVYFAEAVGTAGVRDRAKIIVLR